MTWPDVAMLLAIAGGIGLMIFLLIEWAAKRRKNGRGH